jgi:arylsulfatase A-like enzyme
MKQSRRLFLKTAVAGGVGSVCAQTFSAGLTKRKPNVLLVFPDQWRRDAVGVMRRDPVRTPSLDAFAGQSFLSTAAISGTPLCSPFRASLMTGRFPDQTGVVTNCCPASGQMHLREQELGLAECFKTAGYETAYIGKWHLDVPSCNKTPRPADGAGGWDTYTPPGGRRHGWDWWYAYNTFDRHMRPHYWSDSEMKIEHDGWSVEHETDVAIDWIKNRRRSDRPFIMTLAWNPPHPPYDQHPKEFDSFYPDISPFTSRPNYKSLSRDNQDAKYYDSLIKNLGYYGYETFEDMARGYFSTITGMDRQFQRLLDVLKKTGLEDDTIVVFFSDHGEMMGSHGRLEKCTYYEESVGIPFMVRWPKTIKPDRQPLLINGWDIMPTLLGLCGIGVPSTVSGADLSGCILGQTEARPKSTLIHGITALKDPKGSWRAVRTERYTLACWFGKRDRTELYDLQEDPYQMNPITWGNGRDDLMNELLAELKQWLVKADDPAIKLYSWVDG